MARTVTLATLRTRVRQRADMEGSSFVSDSEVNDCINESIAELHEELNAAYGGDYYLGKETSSTVAGTYVYSLPATFYKLRAVELTLGSEVYMLKPMNLQDRENYSTGNQSWSAEALPRYHLVGSSLYFSPTPSAVHSFTVWFTPAPQTLGSDGATLDGVAGWEEYVVVDAAIKCLLKEESDVSALMARKQQLQERIRNMAEARDAGEPHRVRDTAGWYVDDWYLR